MDTFELFRCRICGEVYFGSHPSHCPFCGAHKAFLVPMANWKEQNVGVELTEKSQENLKEAQGLEYYNTRFYRAAAKSDSPEISGYFKYLAKIESEHYSVFTKLLGAEKDPSILEPSEALGSDIENLHHGREREAMASALYKKFTAEATEPRVREVFASVSQIEADHLHLDEEELKKLGSN